MAPDTKWGRRRSKAGGGGQALDESCDVVDHTRGCRTCTAVRIVGRIAVNPPAIDEGCLSNRLLPEYGCVVRQATISARRRRRPTGRPVGANVDPVPTCVGVNARRPGQANDGPAAPPHVGGRTHRCNVPPLATHGRMGNSLARQFHRNTAPEGRYNRAYAGLTEPTFQLTQLGQARGHRLLHGPPDWIKSRTFHIRFAVAV